MTLQPSSTVPVIEAAAVLEERLIKMVDIERIRYAHFREGSSIRGLAWVVVLWFEGLACLRW